MVYPDPAVSRTRCLLTESGQYSFEVVPRNPNKVLMFIQGGGACWSRFTTVVVEGCWRDKVFVQPLDSGIFRDDPANPFGDHTQIIMPPCSGDLSLGNVTRDYKDDSGVPIEQRGYYNTKAVIDWIKANFGSKPIPELALMGESAGAIAVQIWGRRILTELPHKKASVVADSYVGVFPPRFEGDVFKLLGICRTGVLMDPSLEESCDKGTLKIADVFERTLRDFPDVAFGMLASKYDGTQKTFYNLAAMTSGHKPIMTTDLYGRMVALLRRFHKYPNFFSYVSSSMEHTFVPGNLSMPLRNRTQEDMISIAKLLSQNMLLPKMYGVWFADFLGSHADRIMSWLNTFTGEGKTHWSYCEHLEDRYMPALHAVSKDFPPYKDLLCDAELSQKKPVELK